MYTMPVEAMKTFPILEQKYILLYHQHTFIDIKMMNESIICMSIDNIGGSKARLDKRYKCVCDYQKSIDIDIDMCLYGSLVMKIMLY